MSSSTNPPFRFSLQDYLPAERLEAWQTQYSIAEFALTTPIDPIIDYQFIGYTLGNISVGKWTYHHPGSAAVPLSYALNRSAAFIRRDGMDNYSFNLRDAGSVRGEIDGRPVFVQPGDILVVDQARPYHREIQAGDAVTLLVARDMLPSLPSSVHGTIFSGGISQLLDSYLRSLLDKIGTLSQSEALHAEQATLSLVKAMLSPTAQEISNARNELLSTLYVKIKEYIRQNLESPDLSPDRICKEIGISRSSLYRLFEQDGGVANYIRKRRLLAIHRALMSPESPRHRIGDLAYRYGFNSNTQLSRAFKLEFGHAPSETRVVAGNPQHRLQRHTDTDYSGWLAQIR
ncbi:AraC family transcriptional regulator [Burkholderia lata]|uniref:AraC family transcriptional regulator n=1 Tax=Burkholderia lata (strain ATCC 17760 / DSM 23089 / LMG 22485 / NCIMB 9086 / R18194 / 383) TaxID=482957 RepID=A0A6P2K4U0_BURL3|nr:helix-turn-helix domain-containing protein [Burkholderia lata]VWB49103.1 AraC family transcriptional regulator [Burkholderia lata]VWB90393.1 AraC family transcriptional regulator [Burkholderia lata]